MPEAGYLPIPSKLAKAGVKDMVRISDARMSGTAYGTIVLHVAPDTASDAPAPRRGYARLYHEQILQADEGCDFAFLVDRSGP
jgi:dihydroxy-acid dehydratase